MHFRAHTFSGCSSAASNKCFQLCNTPKTDFVEDTHELPSTLRKTSIQPWPSNRVPGPGVCGINKSLATALPAPHPESGLQNKADPLAFLLGCRPTPGTLCWQYLRITIGLLFIAFVVVHVESHLTDLTMETSFMPVLKKKNVKVQYNASAFQDGYREGIFLVHCRPTLIWKYYNKMIVGNRRCVCLLSLK